MNPFRRIQTEFRHFAAVRRNHDRLIDLGNDAGFAAAKEDWPNLAAIAEQQAELYESQARHLSASWLARVTTALPSPHTFRLMAAGKRRYAGRLYRDAGAS